MTQEEKIRISNLWVGLAQMYGKEISKPAMAVMLNAVADLPSRDIERALNEWAMHSTTGRYPLPAEVRERICGKVQPRDLAVEAASRVIAAVSKFGWNNNAEAKAYIGDLGWRAVERIGGWLYLCENLGCTIQLTTVQAQIRDLCEGTLKLGGAGIHDQPIALPRNEESKQMLSNLKLLEEKGK